MILSIGEILLDIYAETENGAMTMKATVGGAPYNVAANIALNGSDSSFYGVVGKDSFGDFILKEANRIPFKCLLLERAGKANTTLAVVSLHDGECSFEFIRGPGADWMLDIKCLDELPVGKGDIVHFGSLMLSQGEGFDFLLRSIRYFQDKGAFISFDANLRLSIFESEAIAKERYIKIFSLVDFLKLSNEELLFFYGLEEPVDFRNEFMKKEATLFVSFGEKGSGAFDRENSFFVPSQKVTPLDSTGAGDAFYATVLRELGDYLSSPNKNKTPDYFEILKKANKSGADCVSHYGALPLNQRP